MIKKISVIVICCIHLSLYTSEKKPKDIYSLNDLKMEVARAREDYKKNNPVGLHDIMTRGNRINHNPIKQMEVKTSDQHT